MCIKFYGRQAIGKKNAPNILGRYFSWRVLVLSLIACVDAANGAGFSNLNGGQLRQSGLQMRPDPFREDFTGGILEPFDVIEVVMVELV